MKDKKFPHAAAREHIRGLVRTAKNWPRHPDRNFRVAPERIHPGWMFQILQGTESLCWGRWAWHMHAWVFMRLPKEPIPRIDFEQAPNPLVMKMLHASLNSIPGCGAWESWGSWSYLDYFFDWLLYAFGHITELPKEPEPGAYHRLYQVFCLEAMIAWPYDYFGDIMAENKHGRGQGFYPTPHSLVELMTRMNFDEEITLSNGRDSREAAVCDPAVGTGRLLLHASNYSVCLYGSDVNASCVKATTVNGFLYAPWLVQPFSWIKPPVQPPPPPPDPLVPIWKPTRQGNRQGEFLFAQT